MIHSWPVFENKAGLLSQLLRLKQAIGEYDSIASVPMSDDQKVASFLRCLTGQLRQRVNVLMEDSWTYDTLRSVVVRYDASSSKWGASVAATFGLTEGKGGTFQDQPTPMEIDRLGKDCEGKGGKNREGKGNKGDHKGKGKGKGKGKDGKGKAQLQTRHAIVASVKAGHFARDCPFPRRCNRLRPKHLNGGNGKPKLLQSRRSGARKLCVLRAEPQPAHARFPQGESSSLMRRVWGYTSGLISECCVSHNAALHEPLS